MEGKPKNGQRFITFGQTLILTVYILYFIIYKAITYSAWKFVVCGQVFWLKLNEIKCKFNYTV